MLHSKISGILFFDLKESVKFLVNGQLNTLNLKVYMERKIQFLKKNPLFERTLKTRNYYRKQVLPERDRLETCIWW